MFRTITPVLLVLALPGAAFALPAVGDHLGTDAETVTAVLAAAGCSVTGFEVEDGKVEAKCTETATNAAWEIYIDPQTGNVVDLKDED